MSTITLPNIRVSSDLTVKVRLKDGGVAIDWSTLSNIRALIYSDAQRAMAGRCVVTVDAEDATLLVCQYAATKPQYIGVNRIVISATYMNEMKTYDKPALNFVRWTDDQAGEQITIDDPDVEVEIEVEDISSSILQEAVDAAFSAAERADEAAAAAEHMVDIHQGPPGEDGKSPYIGENGHWYEWDEDAGEYVDTGEKAQGEVGTTPDITIGTVTTAEPGTPAAATMTGTPEAPVLNLTIPKGVAGDTPAFTVGEVTTGQPGTPVVVTITGTAAAPVLNVQIPQGLQGNPGSSVDYPFELVNNATTNDATKAATAAVAKGLKDDITQLEAEVDDIADNFITIISPNLFDKTAATSGKLVNKATGALSNSSNWYASDYIDVSDLPVGTHINIKKTTAYSGSAGMAAYNSSKTFTHGKAGDLVIESGDAYVRVSVPASEIDTAMIYVGTVPPEQYMPYGATYYKPKNDADISALDTKIDGVQADSDGNDTITRRKLNWQPCGRWGVTLLTMNSGSFVTATSAYNVVYRPCTEGEMFLFKTTGSFENPIGFCTSIPANGGTYTEIRTIKNTDGEVVVIAPGNGYIVARNDTTGDRDLMLYKLQDADTTTLVPHAITDINETVNKMLSVDSGSADYGTLVTAGSNNLFVSDYIDISGYDMVALPFAYGTSNLILLSAGLFGAIFYDSSKSIHSVVDVTINRVQTSSKAFSIYAVPSGVKYVRFTGNGDEQKCMLGYNRAAEASDNLEELVNDVLRNDAAKTGEKTVFETNPDTEMLQKMVIATKKTYDASTIPPLVLAHISDAHGRASQYSRFLGFAQHWKDKGYVDEIVDTGDVVTDTYSNGVSWRDALAGVEDVITVIGNHDTRASATERESADYPAGQNQWQYHSNISLDADLRNDMYDRYFIGPDGVNPYVSNWGVTQPENAASNGYCYFYKDYTSRNLRLIGLDVMGYDNTQDTWLQARLAEAKTLGYVVVILAHFCGEVMTGLPCHYTSLFDTGSSRSQIDTYNADAHNIPVRVDSFQTDGGVFVGYIIGHYHRDMVNVLTDYPKQLAFAVSSGGVTPTRDFTKVSGSKSYDDFQVVSINTYDKTVRLIKVGADTDYYMRKKGTISVSYEIVTENGVSRVKGVIGEGW